MEFICPKEELQRGVQLTERIVSTRSTLPIIGNILFEASKDHLKILANNLETGVEITLPAEIKSEGSILIPAKALGAIVAKLPSGPILFKLTEKGLLHLSYRDSYFDLHTLPPEEFPTLPKIKEGRKLILPAGFFAIMIKQTIFSTSTSEDKHILNGVFFELGEKEFAGKTSNLRMVATDGYRLAKIAAKVDLKKNEEGTVIIPNRVLAELLRVLGPEEEVQIHFSAEQISFRYQDIYFISRLIQGQFPDYQQVIPKSSLLKLQIPTQSFLEAAERTAVVASGSANIARFDLRGNKLFLLSHSPDIGSIEEVLEVENKSGKNIQISFNIRLIIDVLRIVESESIYLELSEPSSAGLIRSVEDENYVYIVMPIRTQEAT